MRAWTCGIAMLWAGAAAAQPPAIPEEVTAFLKERALCEHFLHEPVDGNTAEQRQRRAFVRGSIDRHCTGTDARLAALKHRYKNDQAALAVLQPLQDRLE